MKTDDDIFDEIDWFQIEIIWHGDIPNLPNVNDLVRLDCSRNLQGLEKVGELMFHTIFLGDSMEKEIVMAWGQGAEDNNLHCEYYPTVDWVSIKSAD